MFFQRNFFALKFCFCSAFAVYYGPFVPDSYAELENDEEEPEYSFYYSNSTISPTQSVVLTSTSNTIDILVAVGQSEYTPVMMTKLQRLIFNETGLIKVDEDDFYFSKNSIIALDGSLGGKEFSIADFSKNTVRYLTIRFVEEN